MAAFGYPTTIISDNDYKFQSASVKEYANKGYIEWKYIVAYNTRGNAKVEGMEGTLKRATAKIVLSTKFEWDISIDLVVGCYRRCPGFNGKAPFENMLG